MRRGRSGPGTSRGNRGRHGPRLPTALRRELDALGPNPARGSDDDEGSDAGAEDVYEYEEGVPEEEAGKNGRYDAVAKYEYEFDSDASDADEDVPSDEGEDMDEDDNDDEEKQIRILQETTGMPRGAFDGKKKKKQPLELPLQTGDADGPVTIHDLLDNIQGKSGYSKIRKRLQQQEKKPMVMEVPLPKVEREKLDRSVLYQLSKNEVTKWERLVKLNREASTLYFENDVNLGVNSVGAIASEFKPRTKFEKMMDGIVNSKEMLEAHRNDGAKILELNKIDVEDVRERQNRLAKMRSLLFRHEMKAKRVKKIKSRTYHRMLKKDKLKVASADLEADPEAAKDYARKQEFKRAEERMTLKHKNTSKWAKRKIKRGLSVQDEGTRAAITAQLQQHALLTRKMNSMNDDSSSSEESSDDDEEESESEAKLLNRQTPPPPPPPQQEQPQPELAREKRKREEVSPDASTEDAPAAASTGGEGAASITGGARHPMWKTSLCSYFRRRSAGAEGCSHGESCRYAHTEEDIRPRPGGTWDPTSDRAKKLRKVAAEAQEEAEEEVTVDEQSLDKCLVGLPRGWTGDRLKAFLKDQGISYATAKKKKGMTVGFVTFESFDQLKNAVQVLKENPSGGREIKIADANRRSHKKVHVEGPIPDNGTTTENGSSLATPVRETSAPEAAASSKKSARDAVTPLAHMPYNDQLEHKKHSMAQILKRLTRNARKACQPAIPLPNWVFKSKEIGGLPCKLEGILESPVVDGYRNKCEFSVGYSLEGKKTVGFMLGNFREGVTAVEEPVKCPNVSGISCKYALMFQDFLQSSSLPLWSRIDNYGFWRQFTVREGRSPVQAVVSQNAESQISEVMLIVQVCSTGVDEALMKEEFDKLSAALQQGAATCSPPLPLTAMVVQDHKGISNAAPADCPLIPLLMPKEGDQFEAGADDKTRIHDHISNLKFSISPTAFFQVNTLAAERLYTLAGDWANLNSDTLLFDVCCGTGTIGLSLAHHVGMVVGIEMNESAVSDANRNALINGIKNCRFIGGKAEDVMGSLLTEYLGSPQQDIAASESNSEINDTSKNEDIIDCSENSFENMDSSTQENDSSESEQPRDTSVDHPTCATDEEAKGNSGNGVNKEVDGSHDEYDEAAGELICGEALLINDEIIDTTSADSLEHDKTCQDGSSIPNNNVLAATACQFKNVVAIVDPPRVGLHPTVIKALRTHPRIRRLVYISCNPDSLVANAIELCTPTSEKQEKNKGNRGWRTMSSAGLARQRTKSMPNSEPFIPKRAMAVDLFPHTSHCEMVMLFER